MEQRGIRAALPAQAAALRRNKGAIQIAINAARAVFGQVERSGRHFLKVS